MLHLTYLFGPHVLRTSGSGMPDIFFCAWHVLAASQAKTFECEYGMTGGAYSPIPYSRAGLGFFPACRPSLAFRFRDCTMASMLGAAGSRCTGSDAVGTAAPSFRSLATCLARVALSPLYRGSVGSRAYRDEVTMLEKRGSSTPATGLPAG